METNSPVKFLELSGLIFAGIFLLVLLGESFGQFWGILHDSDTCWLIQTGHWILSHRQIPYYNPLGAPYAALSNLPIIAYQWLYTVLLALFHKSFGLAGIILFVALMAAFTWFAMARWLLQYGLKNHGAIMITLWITLLGLKPYIMARPMLISLLMSALLLWLIRLKPPRAWLIFPAFFLLWANLHLGFMAGLAIYGLYSLESAWHARSGKPLLCWVLCLLASLINPYGYKLYTHFAQLAWHSPFMTSHIQELQAPPWGNFLFLVYFTLLILGVLGAYSNNRFSISDRLFVLLSLLLALTSFRHLYLLALATLPFLAISLEKLFPTKAEFPLRAPNLSAIGISILVGITLTISQRIPAQFPEQSALSGVIRYLNQHPPERPILTLDRWGSYLIYFSKARSYLDTRMDMLGDARVEALSAAYNLAPGWQQALPAMQIDTMLYPAQSEQARYLSQQAHWQILYQDSGVILLRMPHVVPTTR